MNVLTSAAKAGALFCSRMSRALVYLGAGTIRLADLQADIHLSWADFNARRSEANGGLFDVERELFDRHLPRGARVLLVGSGTGRELGALAAQGYRVSGVEPSPRAVELSQQYLRERGLAAPVVTGFFEDAEVAGPFDAVVFTYFCYSCMPMSSRRVAALRKAAALLAPGGPLLVSYDTTGRSSPFFARLARLSAVVTGSDWRVEPGDVISLQATGVPRAFFRFLHPFTMPELLAEIAAAGLTIVHQQDTGDYAWTVCAAR